MPLYSMTAFGSAKVEKGSTSYRVEIKTLNSRYLEINVRTSRKYMRFEPEINKLIRTQINRGKVDVFLDISSNANVDNLPKLNIPAIDHYQKLLGELDNKLGIEPRDNQDLNIFSFLGLEGVLDAQTEDDQTDLHRPAILDAVQNSLNAAISFRKNEGQALTPVLSGFLDVVDNLSLEIANKARKIPESMSKTYRDRMERVLGVVKESLKSSSVAIPEERLIQEIAILVEKSDIQEELNRLTVHSSAFRDSLEAKEPIGRKMDFYCQEMYREINTIASKAIDNDIIAHVIEVKQTIEKLRQQIQNIE